MDDSDIDNIDIDEEVVLPNSPLGQYLKELDTSETGGLFADTPANETVKEKTPLQLNECSEILPKGKKSYSLKTIFQREFIYWKNLFSSSFLRSNVDQGNEHLSTFLSTTIIKNCNLVPEDRNFINNLSSQTTVIGKFPPTLSDKAFFTCVFLFLAFFVITSIGIISDITFITLFPITLFILSGIFIFCFFLYCQYSGTEYKLACLTLLKFPSSTKIALMLIKDCGIRLIQEAELIARGFTSASLGVAERIELSFELPISSPSRQYSELRKTIFSWLRGTFLDYRALTLDLMRNMPVEEAFKTQNCLATLDMNEFGGFLNHEIDSSEILGVTDNFSIQSLKTMHRVAEMQISEFFKQLAIRLYCMKDEGPVDYWKKMKTILWLNTCTQDLDKKMTLMFHDVYKTYKYYKSIEASYIDDKEVHSGSNSKSSQSNLKVSVHNMCLHLKAALLRLIDIEDQFDAKSELDHLISKAKEDQLDTKTESGQLDTEAELELFKKQVSNMLPLLNIAKSEVAAFEECCNKFTKTLDHLLHPEAENLGDNLQPVQINPAPVSTAPIERCDVERVIQDEVFEAVVSNAVDENQQSGAAFMGEEARKNTEIASFLLKELKNVLVDKADEHRIREQAALAKKMEHCNETNPNIESDTDINYQASEGKGDSTDTKELPEGTTKDHLASKESVVQCGTKSSPVDDSENFDLLDDDCSSSFLDLSKEKVDPFSASIAALAAERRKLMGLADEEFCDGSDNSDSDISNNAIDSDAI